MCGINGIINFKQENQPNLKIDISKMNDLITHRGPDDDGVYTFHNDDYSIAMGMRRLSIIDLSTGKQPMFSKDKSIVIVFNGEIYNYQELKAQLEAKGVTFDTKSDTEVILKLYEVEGTLAFKKLDGMFAFSIYDQNKNKLFVARDFFGEKPLYYTKQKNSLIWGSELKSVMHQINKNPAISNQGLNLYFRLTYIPAPFTIYESIYKLEANHFITYNLTTKELIVDEINHSAKLQKIDISFAKAKAEVNKLMRESVASRSVSDVTIGTFLSGGVDSSVVSKSLSDALRNQINTYSIGFKKKTYDETDKSRVVANLINSNHHEFIIGEDELKGHINEILLNFDEPFADSSAIPTYMVSKLTAKHVKVALTGDGGDEVFGGYNKYYMGKINKKYTRWIPIFIHRLIVKLTNLFLSAKSDERGFVFRIKRLLTAIDYSGNHYWDIISLGFAGNSLSKYLKTPLFEPSPFDYYKNKTGITHPNSLTDYRLIDKHISLEGDMLVKVDRTSMLNSLECRAPFLNKKIWDYTNTLPEQYLMKGWNKKFILKEAFKDEFPDEFLNKSKSGFAVPVGDWLRSSLSEELRKYIAPDFLKNQHIFEISSITKLVNEHLAGKDHTFKVWTFFCFQKWYHNNYMD